MGHKSVNPTSQHAVALCIHDIQIHLHHRCEKNVAQGAFYYTEIYKHR